MHNFDRFYDPIPDLEAYLARIEYTGSREVTKETLAEIMMQHLCTVPFENLTVYHELLIPNITTQALFDKIVTHRRGGYCFEQNGLYVEALKAFGYDAYCVSVRIHMGSPKAPISHRGVVVTLDGRQIFTDVGFGGPAPITPLELDQGDGWQRSGSREYQVIKNHHQISINLREVSVNDEGETVYGPEILMFTFMNVPTEPFDFIPFNLYTSATPDAPFRNMHCISVKQKDGHISVDGKKFTIKKNDMVTERDLTSVEDLQNVLKEYFGIEYDKLTDRFLSM